MKNLEEFYILGLPIETEFGACRFLQVRELPDTLHDLSIMSMSKDHVLNSLRQSKVSTNEMIEDIQNSSLFEAISKIPDLAISYAYIFEKVLEDVDSIQGMNEEQFNNLRKLILKMNCQKEEKINPNPEIQRALERSKRVKAMESENTSFADIVTSVVGYNGLSYNDINNFTIYQLYMTYYRIHQIKNYDASTLFATVSPPKSKIESWSKHIEMFEEEKHFVTYDQFKKTTGSVFE